jgi:hypothetical protein
MAQSVEQIAIEVLPGIFERGPPSEQPTRGQLRGRSCAPNSFVHAHYLSPGAARRIQTKISSIFGVNEFHRLNHPVLTGYWGSDCSGRSGGWDCSDHSEGLDCLGRSGGWDCSDHSEGLDCSDHSEGLDCSGLDS